MSTILQLIKMRLYSTTVQVPTYHMFYDQLLIKRRFFIRILIQPETNADLKLLDQCCGSGPVPF
jgi:hypothetical protein